MPLTAKTLAATLFTATLACAQAAPQTTQKPAPNPLQTHTKPRYPASQTTNPSASPATTPEAPSPVPAQKSAAQSAPAPVVQNQPIQQAAAPDPRVQPSAPRISYQNGQLTVIAENAGLAEVLSGIRLATGIRVEGLSGGGSERVTAKIGPAPVRDVLLSLLEGSRYDFAMLGSETDSQKVERLVLSSRIATSGAAGSAPAQPQRQEPANSGEASDDDDNEGFSTPAPAAGAPPNIPASSGTVKTPEQLLEDLRRLEAEKAQQQQQQQSPPQPGDPNAPRPTRPERPK